MFLKYKYQQPLSLQASENIDAIQENSAKFFSKYLGFISPFTFLFVFLTGLFPYMLLHKKMDIFNTLETWLIYPFLILNTIFLDLLLRKIFSHSRKLPVWVIESALSLLVLHILIF